MAEFRAILDDEEKFNQVNEAVFTSIDTDGSGSIDKAELKTAMGQVAAQAEIPAPSDEDVEAAFKALDVNSDGKINMEEFKTLVRQILEALASG